MSYPHRSTYPPGVYHVVDRATGGGPLYRDVLDCRSFLRFFETVLERQEWTCYAYCLMTTHCHMVLGTQTELSRGMQWLKSMYARRFNERHGRSGALFEKRFWSGPIEDDDVLEAVSLYVVNNPVRAGLCTAAHEWRWSGGLSSGLDR